MKTRICKSKMAIVMLCSTLASCAMQQPGRALSYETSWIGNTFPGANVGSVSTKSVSQDMQDMAVASDGTCYTNTVWDEGGHAAGKYSSGGDLLSNNHFLGDPNGVGIATDGSHIYLDYHAGGFNGVRSYNVDGSGPNWSSLSGIKSTGMTYSGGSLYVTDFANNKVHVLNASTGAETSNFAVSAPARIAKDSGGLWITQKTGRFFCSNVIHRYNTSGAQQSQTITMAGNSNPAGITVDNQGRLLICDNGPDQNIKIYTNITSSPTQSSTFGTTGGIFSGTPGQPGTLKFNGPTAVGADSSGNFYVAQDSYGPDWDDSGAVGSGGTLESYTSGGSRRWVLYGLEFTDTADFELGTDGASVYSPLHHYAINYGTTTAGSEWSYSGYTMRRFSYTGDPRDFRDPNNLGGKVYPASTWMRQIGGKKILFWTGQYAGQIYYDRFNAATDGEVAIPCPNRTNAASSGGTWAIYPDTNGTIWEANESGPIFSTASTGLDGSGNPTWATPTSTAAPSLWTGMERVQYYPASNAMYICGYTAAHPNSTNDWGRAGFILARYDNWSTGNRTERYQIQTVTDGDPTHNPKGFDVAGNYVFVSYWVPHQINVYDNTNGSFVGTITAGSEIGGPVNVGNVDMPYPIHAIQRSNGEYVILNEDNFQGKVVMYRWSPGGTIPSAPTGLGSSPGNTQITLNWTASTGATSYNVYRGTSAGGESTTAIATGISGTTYTNTGLTNGTQYFYMVKAVNSAGTSGYSNETNATPNATTTASYEGEASANTIGNAAFIDVDAACSGGHKVRGMGGTSDGYVIVNGVTAATSGSQTMTIYYTDGARDYKVSVNGGADQTITCPSVGGVGSVTMSVTLNAGSNTIKFHNASANAPSLDRITISGSGGSAPAAPTGLGATAGNTQITLNWTASTGATSYNVYRGTSAGGESTTAIATGISGTTYTNTGLTNGTTYYYKVAAVNASGTSGYSNEANATPAPPTATSYEGEATANTIGNAAFIDVDAACSGGHKVRGMGGTSDGYVIVNNVNVSTSGAKTMTIYYTDGARDYKVSVNGGADQTITCPSVGGVGSVTMSVTLNAGSNTIKFHNASANAPSLDRITIL